MKATLLRLFSFLLLLGGLTALSCWLAMRWMPAESAGRGHEAIHRRLGLTAEQLRQLAPIEARYQEELRQAEAALRTAALDLARILREERKNSPRVRAAVERIHDAMSAVQQATLGHVFAMEPILTPEQFNQILELTARGIEEANGEY